MAWNVALCLVVCIWDGVGSLEEEDILIVGLRVLDIYRPTGIQTAQFLAI